ncbi:MAG TPA: hypothetical protein VHP12_03290, partial [Chitinophagaceae bacterium]|nr:hypothetical protein [Chitinophagaceae bacterium]
MKSLIKISFLSLLVAVFFTACDKVGSLPSYASGTASVLTASTTTIAPAMADSDKTVLTLTWTNPNYANDSTTSKYIV